MSNPSVGFKTAMEFYVRVINDPAASDTFRMMAAREITKLEATRKKTRKYTVAAKAEVVPPAAPLTGNEKVQALMNRMKTGGANAGPTTVSEGLSKTSEG